MTGGRRMEMEANEVVTSVKIIKAANGIIVFYNGNYYISKDQWDFRRIIEDIYSDLCNKEDGDGDNS
jgi:hypothetical protein